LHQNAFCGRDLPGPDGGTCSAAQRPRSLAGFGRRGWGKGRIERRSDGKRGKVGEGKSMGKGRDEAERGIGEKTGKGMVW